MDKLEHYLDQVCRSVGGSRSLRQHIRQELREHLRDAVAEYKAAGLSEEQALDRALADFGGPEQVRSELEATHGSRLLPVVIDKAMQWKEMTMKARWLWISWAHLALAGVVVLAVLWISFATVYLVPRFQMLLREGWLDTAILREVQLAWIPSFLNRVSDVGEYTTWIMLLVAVAWGLFEWRVRSDNKPFIRLSVMGTVAVGLLMVGVVMAAALVIPFMLSMPLLAARSFAIEQIATIDTSVGALEQALAKQDWEAMQDRASRASEAADALVQRGTAARALAARTEPREAAARAKVEILGTQLKSASECLREAQQAIGQKDAERLATALRKFHAAYDPVRETATKLEK